MPEANIQATKKTPITKWWFWSIIVILIVGIAVGVSLIVGEQDDNHKQRQEAAMEVDIAGMTIEQACEKVKSSGWSKVLVFGVIDERGTVAVDDDGHTIYSNCDDTEHKVYYATFLSDKNPEYKYVDENTVYIYYKTSDWSDATNSKMKE